MKVKHLFFLGLTALVGCTDMLEEGQELNPLGVEIQIEGGIDQQYHSRVDDGGFCGGDQIGLYGVNYTADNSVAGTLQDEGNQVDNVRYTFDEDNFKWTSSVSAYYKDVNTHIDLYAYYPYGSPSSVSAYAFEVEKDQKNDGGYGASDFLWAKTEKVAPSENKVKLHFGHRMSCANVILEEGTGFADGEFAKLDKSVLVMNTTRTSTINLATGVVTATGDASPEGTLMMDASDGFCAIVVPQTVKAGSVLFAITVDGVTYHFKNETAAVFESGKQAKFTITVNWKAATGQYEFVLTDTEIVDWIADIVTHGGEARQYFVVNQETPGTLGALIKTNGKNPDKIKNLKITGNVDARDFYFMRDSMALIQAINMKECKIHEYQKSSWDIYGEDEIPNSAFRNKEYLVSYVFPEKVTKIGEYAFYMTSLMGALIIPDDVVEIGSYAFQCGSSFADQSSCITSLSLPHGLKKIGIYSFAYNQKLSGNLVLPNDLEELGSSCFTYCNFTGPLVLPSKITSIPYDCFSDNAFSGDLVIPENVKTIGGSAFQNNSFTGQLVLHNGITEIGSGAFEDNKFQGELIIPNQLIVIEERTFSNNMFSNVVFPEGLIKIEGGTWGTFDGCINLMETLVLPETLLSIGKNAFKDCKHLPGVILPSQLEIIEDGAFTNCYGLVSFVSNAKEPPALYGDPFKAVAKDNFTIEVPEESVTKYRAASGWDEFKRIGAHHDFSVNRRLMRTLNAEHSRTLILRAPVGMDWSIESKPDWVTVSPSSGTGKAEVTVTVNELAKGSADRKGEVVFLLNEKDYRYTMNVEQYDYEYGDGDVITHQTATKGAGVNLVFLGDCFDAYDISEGKYLDGINQAIEHFFAIEPYKTYRDYFNVYTVLGMSTDSGTGTVNTIREAKFGSQYLLSTGMSIDDATCFEYACKAPSVSESNLNESLVVLILNTQEYGGLTYMWSDNSAIAVCPMSDDVYPYDYRGIVQHEAGGHGFGKLADEYIYTNGFVYSCSCSNPHADSFKQGVSYGWYDNLSLSSGLYEVPWSHLFFHPKYGDIVDIYEGGYYHTRGIYRSEPTSCMNNNIPYFSTISRQSIVERIMEYAGETFSLEDFYANDCMEFGSRGIQPSWDEMMTPNYPAASKQHAPKIMSGKPKIGK